MQESGYVSHDYPCNTWLKSYQLSNWHKANYFVVRCKKALLQFILIKIATSILMCIVYPEYELHIHTQPTWDYIIYNRLNLGLLDNDYLIVFRLLLYGYVLQRDA